MNEAANLVFEIIRWKPNRIKYDLTKPRGIASRAADLTKSKLLLGWSPKVPYEEGFRKTVVWYVRAKDKEEVKENLQNLLMQR